MEEIYHVFNKSIAGFKIFNNSSDFSRMIEVIRYYQMNYSKLSFSDFKREIKEKNCRKENSNLVIEGEKVVDIVAYCLMPTHFHLILRQLKEKGISKLMNDVLNSYTRYFNIKHNRKGPLWEGRFKKVLVESDEQLLHLTRYIHLNPVTANIIDNPSEWLASSYNEYLSNVPNENSICNYNNLLEIKPPLYKKFVEDRISYQRELAKIKELVLD